MNVARRERGVVLMLLRHIFIVLNSASCDGINDVSSSTKVVNNHLNLADELGLTTIPIVGRADGGVGFSLH